MCVCAQGRGQKKKGAPAPANILPFPALPSYLVIETDFFVSWAISPSTTVAKCPTQLVNAAHGNRNAIVSKRASMSLHLQGLNPCRLLPGETPTPSSQGRTDSRVTPGSCISIPILIKASGYSGNFCLRKIWDFHRNVAFS